MKRGRERKIEKRMTGEKTSSISLDWLWGRKRGRESLGLLAGPMLVKVCAHERDYIFPFHFISL
jgi:hypothetical protein